MFRHTTRRPQSRNARSGRRPFRSSSSFRTSTSSRRKPRSKRASGGATLTLKFTRGQQVRVTLSGKLTLAQLPDLIAAVSGQPVKTPAPARVRKPKPAPSRSTQRPTCTVCNYAIIDGECRCGSESDREEAFHKAQSEIEEALDTELV